MRAVKALKEEGWELYCWSSGGGEYAKTSAEELGIAACFVGFLPKPDVMIDDVPPQSWPFLRVIHPAEIQQPNKPPEAMAVKCPPSNQSQAPAMLHL
ncbi:MAG: hypothetical protein IPL39_08415 [Opitutaceae bacterium]|nr:hypothetical protein [Opitutaceae bacterium]